jgi:hypothetical protein
LNSEKIWKIQKKGKLNNEKIGKWVVVVVVVVEVKVVVVVVVEVKVVVVVVANFVRNVIIEINNVIMKIK